MVLQTYKFRIYPSRKQQSRLLSSFALCCGIYNLLLGRAKEAYEKDGTNLCSRTELYRLIQETKKENPEFYEVHSQVLQNCADRLSKAFNNFFRRVKRKKENGEHIKAGYPRFKKKVKSITYPQSGFCIEENRLKVSKIGRIPIVLHRAIEGKIKTLTIKRNPAGKWFAIFSCEVPCLDTDIKKHPNKDRAIGIDVGLSSFATLSDGEKIENPHFLLKTEKRLKRTQRKHSRKEKGSHKRKKAGHRVAVLCEKVANQRADFLHKTSRRIAADYGFVAVEDLNVGGMVRNRHLAKSISDVSWSHFLQMLSYKVERTGGIVMKVNPNNTSQTCSVCERELQKKEHIPLSERTFRCPFCGHKEDRDVNASKNILERALKKAYTVGHTGINAFGDITSTPPLEGGQAMSMNKELKTEKL